MAKSMDKPQQPGMVESTELILQGSVARIPISLRGTLGNGELRELSGRALINKSLSSFLKDLGPHFGQAVALLQQLVGGENSNISLQGLSVGYNNRKEQKFIQ